MYHICATYPKSQISGRFALQPTDYDMQVTLRQHLKTWVTLNAARSIRLAMYIRYIKCPQFQISLYNQVSDLHGIYYICIWDPC